MFKSLVGRQLIVIVRTKEFACRLASPRIIALISSDINCTVSETSLTITQGLAGCPRNTGRRDFSGSVDPLYTVTSCFVVRIRR